MNTYYSRYLYALAMLAGIFTPSVSNLIPFFRDKGSFTVPLALMYLFVGVLFGFFWPKDTWRWGIWIGGPLTALTLLSVLFTGDFKVFLDKDLPIVGIPITFACLGSYISARLRQGRAKAIE